MEANACQAKEVFCVLGANHQLITPLISDQCRVVINENWSDGLSSSIKAGVSNILKTFPDTQRILIMLADQPRVTARDLNELIQISQLDNIVASDYGKHLGVPAIFPSKYFDELFALEGDAGAGGLLNGNRLPVISRKGKNILMDIDSPKDYQNFVNEMKV